MNRLSARTRIVLGQIALLISVLMLAVAFELVPDTRAAIREGRVALCETIAVNTSILATRSDTTGIEAALRAVVSRNPQVLGGDELLGMFPEEAVELPGSGGVW